MTQSKYQIIRKLAEANGLKTLVVPARGQESAAEEPALPNVFPIRLSGSKYNSGSVKKCPYKDGEFVMADSPQLIHARPDRAEWSMEPVIFYGCPGRVGIHYMESFTGHAKCLSCGLELVLDHAGRLVDLPNANDLITDYRCALVPRARKIKVSRGKKSYEQLREELLDKIRAEVIAESGGTWPEGVIDPLTGMPPGGPDESFEGMTTSGYVSVIEDTDAGAIHWKKVWGKP